MSYSTDEADVSQGSIPLLNISASDDEETRKRKARDYARRVDTAYAAWREKQTSDSVKGMEERDQMVNDYTDGKRRPKNPDPLGPPVSYMEDRGVFRPLTSPTNTYGLCRFYRSDPNVPLPSNPVLPATTEHVKRLVLLASATSRRYVLMVFQGGTATALGLLQELHTRKALARIPIYQSGYMPRTGQAHTCRAVHFVRMPSKTIQRISTILSARITTRASDVAPVSVS